MERHHIAYLLIVLMGVFLVTVISFSLYNARHRVERRRRKRENAAYEARFKHEP